ncbi:MAG TPA: hypothetical protein VFA85_12785 [Terriglobales bacterium]|nr:hypothetical protein [Terriglobales bacterium]
MKKHAYTGLRGSMPVSLTAMLLLAVSLAVLLCYGALRTAEKIAHAAHPAELWQQLEVADQ